MNKYRYNLRAMNKELKAISLLHPNLFEEGVDWDCDTLEDFDALHEDVQERLLSNKEFLLSYLFPVFELENEIFGGEVTFADFFGEDGARTNLSHTKIVQIICKYFSSDKELILEAMSRHYEFMKYCDSSFKKDREFVLASMSQSGIAYRYIDNSLKNDEEILIAAVTQWPPVFGYLSKENQKNKTIAYIASEEWWDPYNNLKFQDMDNWNIFDHLPDEFRNDKKIMLMTISYAPFTFEYAGKALQKDPDIIKAAGK
jgi:hypothetical protein